MSLSASLNNAVAGLGISSRRAELIASNVANADTPGYVRRDLQTDGSVTGASPSSISVARSIDPGLRLLRMDAGAERSGAGVAQAFHSAVDLAIGDPDQAGSLQDLVARLDASFITAAADPTSDVRLATIANAAEAVAGKLNALADDVTRMRRDTEAQIGDTVERLNADLSAVADLNVDISRLRALGRDPSTLLDQRDAIVDRIAADVPLRELKRDRDQIALMSKDGVILLDGRPAELSFTPRAMIDPDVTYPATLSGLSVNGRDLGTAQPGDGLAGGALGALFQLRDETAPGTMARLDAFAADLAARLQDPAVDPSLGGTQPGLFADNGARVDTSDIAGLAGRLEVNPAISPEDQSTHWRLRDGLGAAAPGPVSDAGQLFRFADALGSLDTPTDPALGTQPTDISGLASRLRSAISLDRVTADDALQRAEARDAALTELSDSSKVDVDAEMRRLLDVEQAYAANARLLQAVGQMMDRLVEI